MSGYLIRNANIVNEGKIFVGDVLVEGDRILKIASSIEHQCHCEEQSDEATAPSTEHRASSIETIDATGKYLLPGIIDDQVHFRDPGLTHKGDLFSESRAAVAGGVTSFMDMPNTDPKTTTLALLEEKNKIAASKALANYAFFFGATNENLDEIRRIDPHKICGVKIFLGASTGNMLVDNPTTIKAILDESPVLVAIHAEDEEIIQANSRMFREKYGEDVPMEAHPLIR